MTDPRAAAPPVTREPQFKVRIDKPDGKYAEAEADTLEEALTLVGLQLESGGAEPSDELNELFAVLLRAVPQNWVDSLLTGPASVFRGESAQRDVENVLNAVRDRMFVAQNAFMAGRAARRATPPEPNRD